MVSGKLKRKRFPLAVLRQSFLRALFFVVVILSLSGFGAFEMRLSGVLKSTDGFRTVHP